MAKPKQSKYREEMLKNHFCTRQEFIEWSRGKQAAYAAKRKAIRIELGTDTKAGRGNFKKHNPIGMVRNG